MFVHFEQVAATAVVKSVHDLNIHNEATHVEVQADTQNVYYTMDGLTPPTAGATGSGMLLRTTDPPKSFLIQDLMNIKFCRGAGSDGKLNLHYSK